MAPSTHDLGVVVDDQGAVRGEADVQLDPVGAQSRARTKASRVFSPIPPAGSGLPRWAYTAGTVIGSGPSSDPPSPGPDFGAEMGQSGRIPGRTGCTGECR